MYRLGKIFTQHFIHKSTLQLLKPYFKKKKERKNHATHLSYDVSYSAETVQLFSRMTRMTHLTAILLKSSKISTILERELKIHQRAVKNHKHTSHFHVQLTQFLLSSRFINALFYIGPQSC